MISSLKHAHARKLLAAGYSRRHVARAVGIARGTVDAIVAGRLQPQRKRFVLRNGTAKLYYVREEPERYERCAGCGAVVAQPCLACFIRWVAGRKRRKR